MIATSAITSRQTRRQTGGVHLRTSDEISGNGELSRPAIPTPSRRSRRESPKRRITSAALAAAAGPLLAVGLSAAPAGAAVSGTALGPQTLSSCETGTNNTYEYYTWCKGSGPTSYRAVAYCADGEVVLGVERWDGDNRESYASCENDNLNSTLDEDWGIILCSSNSGAGTYQGYYDRHGDIKKYLEAWGGGNVTTGGNWACEYYVSGEPAVSPTQPELSPPHSRPFP